MSILNDLRTPKLKFMMSVVGDEFTIAEPILINQRTGGILLNSFELGKSFD